MMTVFDLIDDDAQFAAQLLSTHVRNYGDVFHQAAGARRIRLRHRFDAKNTSP
jgi:hypothetical protein